MNKSKKVEKKTISLELDDLDQNIIRELRVNGRQRWRELAKKMRVSPVTIMNRINRLEKTGVIKGYTVNVDYKKMGLELTGLIGITVPGTKYDEIAAELLRMPEIIGLYAIDGEFDLVAFFKTKNMDEFTKIVQGIYKKEQVRTQTHFAVPLKENYEKVESTTALKTT